MPNSKEMEKTLWTYGNSYLPEGLIEIIQRGKCWPGRFQSERTSNEKYSHTLSFADNLLIPFSLLLLLLLYITYHPSFFFFLLMFLRYLNLFSSLRPRLNDVHLYVSSGPSTVKMLREGLRLFAVSPQCCWLRQGSS